MAGREAAPRSTKKASNVIMSYSSVVCSLFAMLLAPVQWRSEPCELVNTPCASALRVDCQELTVFCAKEVLPDLSPPVRRQIFLRLRQDFADRLSRRGGDLLKICAGVLAGEDVVEPLVKVRFHGFGQVSERLGVNQITARILEEPRLQIEIAERTVLFVA